jgi:dihydroceramidase
MAGEGYWTVWGAPALVDWCEANYVGSTYVAELLNTASSVAMVMIALAGLWWVRAEGWRFMLGMGGLAVVGLGSAAFHGTLLRVAQAADELPMIWLGIGCVWTVTARRWSDVQARPWALGMVLFGLAFMAAYALVPWAFALFIAVYGAMIAWVVLRTIWLTWGQSSTAEMRLYGGGTIFFYLGSFFFVWLPEHVLLPCDHPLQALQLHSWWHLGSAVGTVCWWRWAAADHRRVRMVGG